MTASQDYQVFRGYSKSVLPGLIAVAVTGFEHMSKLTNKDYPDTFEWVAGPAIVEFCKSNNVSLMATRTSDEPNVTTFFFTEGNEDIAALFKLTFA